MNRVISNRRLIVLFSCAIFIAQTLAYDEISEQVKNEFFAHRRRQLLQEARVSARTSRNSQQYHPDSDIDTTNMAGALQIAPSASPGETFNFITAQWILPAYSAPIFSPLYGAYYASEWIGIDGYGDGCNGVSLQAGVYGFQANDPNTGVTSGSIAWYQWSPNGRVEVLPFDATPGHQIAVSITADTSSSGTVVLNNLSTGDSRSISVSPPSPTDTLCGQNVEWIVGTVKDNSGNQLSFSHVDTVYFQNCAAKTTSGSSINFNGATTLQMLQNGTPLEMATVVDAGQLKVEYIDPTSPPP